MQDDQLTLARARLAIREAVGEYLFEDRRRIQMIDYGIPIRRGQKLEDERAIRFHVDQKFQPETFGLDEIRGQIGGFQTDVIEADYNPQQAGAPASRSSRVAPLRGGISISDEWRNTFGTLGCVVVDRDTGEEMILSNWHVLIGNQAGLPGQRIFQPGRLDGGSDEDVVAELVRHAISQNIDAAVARLNGRRGVVNDQFEFGPIRGITRPMVGMKVIKSGRRTGITHGEVVGVGGAARMQYQFREALIHHVVTIESREISSEYSLGGDSGSMVINEETHEAVGLHFAGNSFFDTGLAVDIRHVLLALNVDIVTTTPMIVMPGTRRMAPAGAGQPELVKV